MPINTFGPLYDGLGPIGYVLFCVAFAGGTLWLCRLAE